jgi:hypothetical protein
VFSPHDLPDVAEALGRSRTKLPLIMLVAGLAGAAFAYWFQWFTAVDYPLNAGGRPVHAGPAFILITFETGVLCAACAGFIAFFALLRLPQLWTPVAEIGGFEHATVDRFWVAVSADDARFDVRQLETLLAAHAPRRIVHLDEEPAA